MLTLDIVIISYNSCDLIKNCLKSIESCRRENYTIGRVIVIDNASRDWNSEGLSVNLPLSIVHLDYNIGYGAACNLGAKIGHSKYLLFLNSDIELQYDSLSIAINSLESNSEFSWLGGRMQGRDGKFQPSRMVFPEPRHMIWHSSGLIRLTGIRSNSHFGVEQDSISETQCSLGAFVLIRRNVFEYILGFDETFFLYYEEIDLMHRLRNQNYMGIYHSGVIVTHWGGFSSKQQPVSALEHSVYSRLNYARRYFTSSNYKIVRFFMLFLEPIPKALQLMTSGVSPITVINAYCLAAKKAI